MAPLFTVITVTYNAEHTIGRTLQSVRSQTCQLFEHLIIDGDSKDGTLDVIDKHSHERLRVYSQADSGIYDAMNKGITLTKGDYIIFLNAGDKFHAPDTLQKYADAIMDNDYPGIVYGQTDLVDDSGKYLGPRHLQAPEVLTLNSMKEGMVVCHQAMAVYNRIAVFYNLRYKYSADYEWCIICLQHSKRNVYIPETTIDYLSEGTTTANHIDSLVERFKIMRMYFGLMTAIKQHIRFVSRYRKRRATAVNNQ